MAKAPASTQNGNAAAMPAPGFLSIGEAHAELMRRGAEEDPEANRDDDSSNRPEDDPRPEPQIEEEEDDFDLDEDDDGIPEELDFEDEDDDLEDDNDLDFDEDDDDQPQRRERLYTVKIDGEEKQVTLSELQNGYQRDADYRQKTMSLSEKEQALAAAQEEAFRNRDRYAEQLDIAIKANESIIETAKEIDWDALYEENPFEYMKKKEEVREAKEKIQANEAELQKLNQEQSKENEAKIERYKLQQKALIVGDEKDPNNPGLIPEWRDAKVARKETKEMEQFMLDRGLTAEEISQVWDARVVSLVRDAYLYSKGKKVANKKVRKAPKMTRASKGKTAPATSTRKIKTLEKELDSGGGIHTAANLLLEREKHAAQKARRNARRRA